MGWVAAHSVDTSLGECAFVSNAHRTEITQHRVPLLGILEALDVIEHVGLGPIRATPLAPTTSSATERRGSRHKSHAGRSLVGDTRLFVSPLAKVRSREDRTFPGIARIGGS
jgi:hypothetical protein